MYILILFVFASGPVGVTTAEFGSLEKCETAGQASVATFTGSGSYKLARYVCVRK